MTNLQNYIHYSPQVHQPPHNNQPILPLQSTIISHRIPYPQNLQIPTTLHQIITNNPP
ncbi:pseudouridine-5'-phosphate glycosidase, partial [Staphylococcus aureus]|uniref:pseudouridine-5'-phosphate glycosidase n=1 Tax=Staphylococcus aureus TaxID=1280 RepID=UPI001642FC64